MIDVPIWYILLLMDTSYQSQMPIYQLRARGTRGQSTHMDICTCIQNTRDGLSSSPFPWSMRPPLLPWSCILITCPLMLNIYSASINVTACVVYICAANHGRLLPRVYVNRSLLMKQRDNERCMWRKGVKYTLMNVFTEAAVIKDWNVQFRHTLVRFYLLENCKTFLMIVVVKNDLDVDLLSLLLYGPC